jgi:GMP synthase (glutamine-hydrolysing)
MTAASENRLPWLVVRHVEHEHIGTLATALKQAGMKYQYLDVFRGDAVPESLAGFRGLIVMGGPMGVCEADRYPFLKREQELIRHAADTGAPVLGICLGAQLVAGVLGARVYPGPRKEIGWYAVEVVGPKDNLTRNLSSSFMAFHWHGDTFDLPPGAVRLFRSELYENQGFRWGSNVYAVQFHFEITAAMVEDWLADKGCRAELAAVPDVKPESIRQETRNYVAETERLSGEVFRSFLALPARG